MAILSRLTSPQQLPKPPVDVSFTVEKGNIIGINISVLVGCDPGDCVSNPNPNDFNPRIRVGCDDARTAFRSVVLFQSTHPRRMRRTVPRWKIDIYANFNPRIRVGCDRQIHAGILDVIAFQSTHPRRMRPAGIRTCWHMVIYFNPRIRVGCDYVWDEKKQKFVRFQSTHPRRMRRRMSV